MAVVDHFELTMISIKMSVPPTVRSSQPYFSSKPGLTSGPSVSYKQISFQAKVGVYVVSSYKSIYDWYEKPSTPSATIFATILDIIFEHTIIEEAHFVMALFDSHCLYIPTDLASV